jgi:hypothetical protein
VTSKVPRPIPLLRKDIPWSAEDDNLLRELASSGESAAEIAKHMNRTTGSVRNRASKLNIPLAILVGLLGVNDEEKFLAETLLAIS